MLIMGASQILNLVNVAKAVRDRVLQNGNEPRPCHLAGQGRRYDEVPKAMVFSRSNSMLGLLGRRTSGARTDLSNFESLFIVT